MSDKGGLICLQGLDGGFPSLRFPFSKLGVCVNACKLVSNGLSRGVFILYVCVYVK